MNNKIGNKVFWTEFVMLQDIEEGERPSVKSSIVEPVTKTRKYFYKVLSSWVLFVGISFTLLTMKILIESMTRLK